MDRNVDAKEIDAGLAKIFAETARLSAGNKTWAQTSAVVPFALGLLLIGGAIGIVSLAVRIGMFPNL